jgi:hypothetical protein
MSDRAIVDRQTCACPCCGQPTALLHKAYPVLADTLVILLLIGRPATTSRIRDEIFARWGEEPEMTALTNRLTNLLALGLVERSGTKRRWIWSPKIATT